MEASSLLEQAAAQAWQRYASPSQISTYITPEFRIAQRLLSVAAVESVYINRTREITRVWTIIDRSTEETFDAIYEMERLVINELAPERFDFHVVAREGRELRSILTLSCPGWVRR